MAAPLICHGTLWSIRHCFVEKINKSYPLTHLSLWEMNAYCVLLGGSVANQLPFYSYKSGCFYVKDTSLFMTLATMPKRYSLLSETFHLKATNLSVSFWARLSIPHGGEPQRWKVGRGKTSSAYFDTWLKHSIRNWIELFLVGALLTIWRTLSFWLIFRCASIS